MSRKLVMEKIRKENETFSIKIIGNEKDKDDAFFILSNTQDLFCDQKDIYHGIKNKTLRLLKNAEIKYIKINQNNSEFRKNVN